MAAAPLRPCQDFSKWNSVVHVGGEAAVRLSGAIHRRAADNSNDGGLYPANTIILVLEAADLQPHDRIHVGMRPLHSIVVAQQSPDGAAAGNARGDEGK